MLRCVLHTIGIVFLARSDAEDVDRTAAVEVGETALLSIFPR